MPSSLSLFPRKTSQHRPPTRQGAGMWVRPARPTEGGMQSLFQPINILGLGGAKNSPRGRAAASSSPPSRSEWRKPCRCNSTGGRGRRLLRPHRPSPAADTKGPLARGEPRCRPESHRLEPKKAPILLAHIRVPPALRSPKIRPPGPYSRWGRGALHISKRKTHPPSG